MNNNEQKTEIKENNINDDNLVFKFSIIGDSGVGKSCIIYHYIYNKFKVNSSQTLGVDFSSKKIVCGNQKIKLQIWDIAGQEKFRSVGSIYYRGTIGLIVVFDITKKESFIHIESWLDESKEYIRKDCSIILVGNKCDLEDQRQVNYEEALNFAKSKNILYLETSCINGQNIDNTFFSLCKNICDNINENKIDKNSLISNYAKALGSKIIKNEENDYYKQNNKYYCC